MKTKNILSGQANYKKAYYTYNVIILSLVTMVFLSLFIKADTFNNKFSIINISGKQRMLSQKIIKQVYYFRENESSENEIILRQTLVDFFNNHEVITQRDGSYGISGDNSKPIIEKLKLLSSYMDRFRDSVRCILGDSDQCESDTETYLEELKRTEILYLSLMDNVVFSYELEAKRGAQQLKIIILISLFLIYFIIMFSGRSVFLPVYDGLIEYLDGRAKRKLDSVKAFNDAQNSTLTHVVTKEIDKNILEVRQLLEKEELDRDQLNRHLDDISNISKSMRGLLEEGSFVAGVKLFNVNELLEEIKKTSRDIVVASKIKIDIENVDENLFARGRKAEVYQVILNLVMNSITRVSDLPEKWISITAGKEFSYCTISIIDSSYSLKDGEEKVFSFSLKDSEQFSQESFNFWISSKILERQSARIEYDITDTHTKFKISLPLPGSEYNIDL